MAQEENKEGFEVFKTLMQGTALEQFTETQGGAIEAEKNLELEGNEEPIVEGLIEEEVEVGPEVPEESDIKIIGQHFAEKGVLVGFNAELDDEDAFEDAINTTVEARVKEYKDSIPEEARYYLEYLEQGGDPRNYAEMMARPDYSKMDIKDEANQKRVLRDYLSIATRLTPDQIERKIERYIEKDSLDSEAAEALEELKYAQEQEREQLIKSQREQQEAQVKAYESYKENLKKNIESRKDIRGFTVSEAQKKQLYDHMIKPVTKDGKTQLMLNSEKDPDIMLKYAFLDMIGWDIEKLSKYVETKITKGLKDKLQSGDTMTKVKGAGVSEKGTDFSAFKNLVKS